MFFLMFLGVQSVNAQASFVSNTEAITILETELASATNDLQQATPGTNDYLVAETKTQYYTAVIGQLNSGQTVDAALENGISGISNAAGPKLVQAAATTTQSSPVVMENSVKGLYRQTSNLLQQ